MLSKGRVKMAYGHAGEGIPIGEIRETGGNASSAVEESHG